METSLFSISCIVFMRISCEDCFLSYRLSNKRYTCTPCYFSDREKLNINKQTIPSISVPLVDNNNNDRSSVH